MVMQLLVRLRSVGSMLGPFLLMAVGGLLSAGIVGAQDLTNPRPAIIPVPTSGFEISRLQVDAVVRGQSAKVRISNVLKNPSASVIEASFLFPLPDDAVVGSLTLLVDGKELPGNVLDAAEARRIYEATVRRQRDPALLEYAGRRLIRSRVFPIPAGQERTVEFEYTVVPMLRGNLRELRLPLRSVRGAQALGTVDPAPLKVQELNASVVIHSEQPLSTLYCPSHGDARIEGSAQQKTVSLKQQTPGVPDDFVVMFRSDEEDGVPTVLSYRRDTSEPGYFMVLAAPADQQPRPIPGGRSIVMVIDRSGSMRGEKFVQAQLGIRRLLESLNPDDHFNLVVYDSEVELFRNELQAATPENLQAGREWADALKPQGGTNISEALRVGLKQAATGDRPAWVLFLTDGLPTAGVTDEKQIAALAVESNTKQARVFSLGVGYDVNTRLLDRLSNAHRGRTAYVLPGEQIDSAVAAIESGIANPLLTDLTLQVNGLDGKPLEGITRVWPKAPADLYRGEVFVVTGRYRTAGDIQLQLSGQREGVAVTLSGRGNLAAESPDSALSFVERLWAGRRIAELTVQMDQNGESEELLTELLELSKRYGILTPWTAFLADERQSLDSTTALPQLRGVLQEQARRVSGAEAIHSRGSVQMLSRAFGPLPQSASKGAAVDAAAAPSLAGAGIGGATSGGVKGKQLAVDMKASTAPNRSPRIVAGRTFFWKDGCWMDVRLQPTDRAGAKQVTLFSDEYFRLTEAEPEAAACLASLGDDRVLIRLGQVVYLIEPSEVKSDAEKQ